VIAPIRYSPIPGSIKAGSQGSRIISRARSSLVLTASTVRSSICAISLVLRCCTSRKIMTLRYFSETDIIVLVRACLSSLRSNASEGISRQSAVCNRLTNRAAMLPPRRPGNCVAPQHWLRTQGQEPLLLTLMAALCLRGDSCQHRIEGISFSRWFSSPTPEHSHARIGEFVTSRSAPSGTCQCAEHKRDRAVVHCHRTNSARQKSSHPKRW